MEPPAVQNIKNTGGYPVFATIGIGVLYFICGKLSLSFATINPSASVFWLPTSIALASFLIFGKRIWPAVFIGAFFVNFTTSDQLFTSLAIALGNTLEGLVGAYLINKYADGINVFKRTSTFYRFLILAVGFAPAISATIGTLALTLGGLSSWDLFWDVWSVWWLGDAAGALIFTPAFILWANSPKPRLNIRKLLEFLALTSVALVMLWVILASSFSFSYLIMPLLIWLLIRFDPREAAAFIALFSLVTILTTDGGSSFSLGTDKPLIFIQSFIAVLNFSALPLAISFNNHKIAKWQQDQITFIVESAHEAVVGKTLDGTITYWNAAAEELYGYKKEEMLGEDVIVLVPKEKRKEYYQIMEDVAQGLKIENFETTRIRKDGKRIKVLLQNSPIIDDQGNIIGVSTMASDITMEKKKVRKEYEEKLKEVEKIRQEFIQNAAHELRTPLAIIKGNMDLTTQTQVKRGNLLDTFEVIDEEVRHLSNIITNLITLSSAKKQATGRRKGYQKVFLADVINAILENYKSIPGKTFISNLESLKGIPVWGDLENLQKLFTNLLDNAVAYTGEGGRIEVSGNKNGGTIDINISDNGFGISEEELPHIFEEFYRTEKSRENGLGKTGLGLSLVKSIAEAHAGRINVKSRLGEGSSFTVSLPEAKI